LRITILGSSDKNFSKKYSELAYNLGKELASLRHVIVTGGYDGIMKDVCRGAGSYGQAKIEGVISPEFSNLDHNKYITKKVEKPNISSRLYYMINKSRVLITFPGSVGTIAELWMSIYCNNVSSRKMKIFVHTDLKNELNRSLANLALYGDYNININFFTTVDEVVEKL